jgi:hypothetical protein
MITCSNKKHEFVYVLQSSTFDSFAHCVRYLVTVMIYLAPDLFVGGLIGPTKSFPICQIPTRLIVVLGASRPFY